MWDLTANACSYELVPEVGTAVRSLTMASDGSLVVAANNKGACYVWRLQRGMQTTAHFEPLHKLQAHDAYILKCLLSPDVRLLATASSDKTARSPPSPPRRHAAQTPPAARHACEARAAAGTVLSARAWGALGRRCR